MTTVVVERTFETPTPFDDVQAMETEFAWCLEQNTVTFLCSYFSLDRTRMICLYSAPDVEAVRRTQVQANMPFDRIYRVDSYSAVSS